MEMNQFSPGQLVRMKEDMEHALSGHIVTIAAQIDKSSYRIKEDEDSLWYFHHFETLPENRNLFRQGDQVKIREDIALEDSSVLTETMLTNRGMVCEVDYVKKTEELGNFYNLSIGPELWPEQSLLIESPEIKEGDYVRIKDIRKIDPPATWFQEEWLGKVYRVNSSANQIVRLNGISFSLVNAWLERVFMVEHNPVCQWPYQLGDMVMFKPSKEPTHSLPDIFDEPKDWKHMVYEVSEIPESHPFKSDLWVCVKPMFSDQWVSVAAGDIVKVGDHHKTRWEHLLRVRKLQDKRKHLKFASLLNPSLEDMYANHYDIQSHQDGTDVIIYFPEFYISNSRQRHRITDMYVKISFDKKQRITDITGARTSLSLSEYFSGYVHSHRPSRNFYGFSGFCLGDGPLVYDKYAINRHGFSERVWDRMLVNLWAYLQHESGSGGPFIRMSEIVSGNIQLPHVRTLDKTNALKQFIDTGYSIPLKVKRRGISCLDIPEDHPDFLKACASCTNIKVFRDKAGNYYGEGNQGNVSAEDRVILTFQRKQIKLKLNNDESNKPEWAHPEITRYIREELLKACDEWAEQEVRNSRTPRQGKPDIKPKAFRTNPLFAFPGGKD
jgi:hypothetical protein